MQDSKIKKETKQQIALNYAESKTKSIKNDLIDATKNFINVFKITILKINETDLEKLNLLIGKVNSIKNINIRNNFFSNEINIDRVGIIPLVFDDIHLNVFENNFIKFYYVNKAPSLNNKQDLIIINENNFKYLNFSNNNIEELLKDPDFKIAMVRLNLCKDFYNSSLETAFNNCYELIRSIRTLERIKKNFPDVVLYLPETIVLKDDSLSIVDSFKNL